MTLVFLGIYAGFVISQPSKNPQRRDPDFIAGLQDFSVRWIGSSHISNSLIESLDRKLAASGANKLVILELPTTDVSGDILFVDGYWFGSSESDMSFLRRFVNSRKPVIILGGDRTAVSAVILNQLQDLLSEGSIEDLYRYSVPVLNEELVLTAVVILWHGEKVTTGQAMMAGNPATDEEALDSLIHNMLRLIVDNWRR